MTALLIWWQVILANFVLFCSRSNFCHPPGSYFTEVIKNNNNKQPFQSRQLTESCHKGTLRCDVKPELSAEQRSLQQRCTELQWLSQTCTYITVYCSLFRSASGRVASNGPGTDKILHIANDVGRRRAIVKNRRLVDDGPAIHEAADATVAESRPAQFRRENATAIASVHSDAPHRPYNDRPRKVMRPVVSVRFHSNRVFI